MELLTLSLNLSIIVIMCTISNASLDTARTLQIFSGTLTKVACSAGQPGFRLTKQQMEYNPDDYDQLPDLFDIEAILSTNRDNVTLFINGTIQSNNVTVTCADFTDFFSGHFDPLFTLLLEFVSILPAPNHVQYSNQSPTGQLQIMWEPPTLLKSKLIYGLQISVDRRITHYIIYITTEESTVVGYNISGTFFTIEPDNVSCSLSVQVAAVNPAGMGEFSPPQDVDWCTDLAQTVTHKIQAPFAGTVREICDKRDKLLSDWAISSTAFAITLAVVCTVLIVMLMKRSCTNVGVNRDLKNMVMEKEIELRQNEVYGINLRPL